MKVILLTALMAIGVAAFAACDKLLLEQNEFSLPANFDDADEKAYWDLTYLKDAGVITDREMNSVLIGILFARENGLCEKEVECYNAQPIIDAALSGDKILDDILHGFAGTDGVAERVGRAAREALENHGERSSREARRRAERRFGERGRDHSRTGGQGDASRLGDRCRRC